MSVRSVFEPAGLALPSSAAAADRPGTSAATGARCRSLSSALPFAIAILGALALALGFPKTNAFLLAPIGAIGLFWAWFGVSPARAFWLGWLAGTVFFYIDFAWFSESAGALIAPFGFLLALGPALVEALLGFALAGLCVALVARKLRGASVARAFVPLGAAAAFTAFEWLRAEGLGELGVPFGSLGLTQTGSPAAPVAAFIGTYGLTFLICLVGAYVAYALRLRERRASFAALLAVAAVAASVGLCAAFAPARFAGTPALRVAAIQGNIAQSIKFRPDAFWTTIRRYEQLTLLASRAHPQLIVWPETVVPIALNRYPAVATRLAALAKRVRAELVVGSLAVYPDGDYNVLYVFSPTGSVDTIYRKRQLVPFAEHLPFAHVFGWLPWAKNVSDFIPGSGDGLFRVGNLRVGPMICWEADFSKNVLRDVRDGATALVLPTDDAWFGTSAGPYAHAQIAQMRALETGRYIVRAASTGISGIIAPDGRYTSETKIGEATTAPGYIGTPVDTPYARLGDGPLAALFAATYAGVLFWRGRSATRGARRSSGPSQHGNVT